MSIMYKYLDKKAAAIAAIKDYNSMQFIIHNTDRDITLERDKMVGGGSQNMDGMPHAHNPAAAEDRIVNGIDEIDVLKERYRQAVEYMNWFQPAWDQLTDEEKYILESFYGAEGNYGSNTIDYVAEYLSIERTTVYKRKNRALDRLSVLLFGKV